MGVSHFLPLRTELREWSDRKQEVSTPLFSGYLFVRMNPATESRLPILKIPGVAGFVGNNTGPLPIPNQQIEDIQTVLSEQVAYELVPALQEGDLVRVVRGVLTGVEGKLIRMNSSMRLVISVEMIHQALAVSVSRGDVVPAAFPVAREPEFHQSQSTALN